MNFADRFAPREVPRATGVFADRGAESSAFLKSVLNHLAYLDSEGDAPPAARRNVLAYYGVGGFGKSKLSYWLERWLVSGEQPNPGWAKPSSTARPLLTSRVDLERLGRLSVEDFVLTLRATAGASGIPLNSFDVALRAYWQQTHGTEELPAMPVRRTAFAPIERLNLGEQFKESVSEALAEVGVGFALPNLAFRLLTELNRMRQERGRRTLALANPDLEAVLEAIGSDDPSSALPWLVGLMAWDIRQVELPKRPLWVVFVDTYEIVNAPADRRPEAAFQSLVLALPSVLWVVTGQRKLDWATDRHEGVLVRTGPTYWPGLADGAGKEPRQHLIGQLVFDDADEFLRGGDRRRWSAGSRRAGSRRDHSSCERLAATSRLCRHASLGSAGARSCASARALRSEFPCAGRPICPRSSGCRARGARRRRAVPTILGGVALGDKPPADHRCSTVLQSAVR